MIENKQFGQVFQEVLTRNGLSHRRAASVLHVPRSTLISWTHSVVPRPERIAEIFDAFSSNLAQEEIDVIVGSLQSRLTSTPHTHSPETKQTLSEHMKELFENPE